MFDFIEGKVEYIDRETATIGVGGIGYAVHIGKASPIRAMTDRGLVRVWTELIIREDRHELYGFSTLEERALFRLLREVSGIGPKVALTIINAAEREILIQAIAHKDIKPLQALPGIGKKLAERIVVELHEKIIKRIPQEASKDTACDDHDHRRKALLALKTLGFTEEEAKTRLKKVAEDGEAPQTVEELIQKALQT